MAWTPPIAFSSGDPLTLTLANALMVDNPQYLYDTAGIWDAKVGYSKLGSAGTFSFTNLSQAYDHLILIMHLKSDYSAAVNDTLRMRFNNDTSGNYAFAYLQGQNVTASTSSGATQTSLFGVGLDVTDSHATPTALPFSPYFMVIPQYTNTSFFKQCISVSGYRTGTSAATIGIKVVGAAWENATPAAITRIDLAPNTGTNFVIGSEVSIFGAYSV